MALEKNATVKVIRGIYEGKTGRLIRVYKEVDVGVVDFDDGEIGKVNLSSLTETEPETEPEITRRAREIQEIEESLSGGRKISKADFDAALAKITNPTVLFSAPDADPIRVLVEGMTAKVVGVHVGMRLFEDGDVVVISEDRFISLLWDVCNPANISETIGKKMDNRKCIAVALAAMITLEDLVPVLFGGSYD